MSLPSQEVICELCEQSKALLYCPKDSAKLCLGCDSEMHSANALFQTHTRSLLCNSCCSSGSSVYCRTESSVLCHFCDLGTHQSFGPVHDRRPIEGFKGCPSATELANFLGLEDLGNDSDYDDYLVEETPLISGLDNPIFREEVVDDGQPAIDDVSTLPKNQDSFCGKNFEEVLSQIRKMGKKDPNITGSLLDLQLMNNNSSNVHPIDNNLSNLHLNCLGFEEDQRLPSFNLVEMNHLVILDSDIGEGTSAPHDPMDSDWGPLVPKVKASGFNSEKRDSAILRYKEQRKKRRYESRKARANTMMRVKGRSQRLIG